MHIENKTLQKYQIIISVIYLYYLLQNDLFRKGVCILIKYKKHGGCANVLDKSTNEHIKWRKM